MGVDHVIQRAKERYGLDLRPGDVARMEQAIRAGQSVLLRRDDNGAGEKHAVLVKGTVVLAVFQTEIQLVVTVLPPTDLSYRRHMEGKRLAMKAKRAEAKKSRVTASVTFEGEDDDRNS